MSFRLSFSLRTRVLIYLLSLHALLAVLAFQLIRQRPAWLLAFELVLVLSLVIATLLLRAFFVPIELIKTGAELIQERDFTTRFHPLGQPEMDQLIDVYNGMIDQLREERLRLREHNELFDRIVEVSPGGILISDLDGRVDQLNPSAERLLGVSSSQVVGQSLEQFPGPLGEALSKLDVGESHITSLHNGRRVRCRHAEFRDRGFSRSFYLLEELTEELRRSERSAYEKLVRLVAHEVNNSVTSVSSLLISVKNLTGDLAGENRDDAERALDVASARMEHLGTFINDFADVVRLPPPDRRRHDVNELLADIVTLMEPWFEQRQLHLVRQVEAPLPPASIDKNQIEQVLLNVLKNAAEAVDPTESPNATITLASGCRDSRGWIEVRDTGPGISPAARDQLFTPFFTTKANGCGLGLMIVKEVLLRHGFDFTLENQPGGGAVFRILL